MACEMHRMIQGFEGSVQIPCKPSLLPTTPTSPESEMNGAARMCTHAHTSPTMLSRFMHFQPHTTDTTQPFSITM